jgi:alpha-beta hydrolase superfamily lysophospholipase
MAEHTFTDPDGVDVYVRTWPRDGAKAHVVIAHGMSEHVGRYDRFARALNDAGYSVSGLDHRGHGRTGDVTGKGRLGAGTADALVEDLHHVIEESPRPVVLFGHSMGSMIGQAYLTRHGDAIDACVLSGCPGVLEGSEEIAAGLVAAAEGGMADEAADLLSANNEGFEGRTSYDWLSRDPAEVDAYVADPYCGPNNPMTYGFLAGLFGVAGPATSPDAIANIPTDLPVLFITGTRDPVASGTKELESRLRDHGLDVTALWYDDARHELLNETNRDDVTRDVIAWLDSTLA